MVALMARTNPASIRWEAWSITNWAASRRSSSSARSAREATPSRLPVRRKFSVSRRPVDRPSNTLPDE